MKKLVLMLTLALIGLTATAQMIQYGAPRNVTNQKVQIDSVTYSLDSVPTFYFKVVRTIQDTTGQMRSTPAELKAAIISLEEMLKANTKYINQRFSYVRDSIKDKSAQQSLLQSLNQVDQESRNQAAQLDMYKKTQKAFLEKLGKK